MTLQEFADVDDDYELEFPETAVLDRDNPPRAIYFGPRGQWLFEVDDDASYRISDISFLDAIVEPARGRLVPRGQQLTAITPLLGRYSLLAADRSGAVTQWFLHRGEFGPDSSRRRTFEFGKEIRQIVSEPRRKGFIAVDVDDVGHIAYTTSGSILESFELGSRPTLLTVAPRSDRLVAVDDKTLATFEIDNPHPEIAWSTLWNEIWYEGYAEPVYSWQSSSAETDFEPKFSLMPLLFGTLKAAFYAMLFAMPLAIMGAIYTAYFMTPAMRSWVKPGIEIMAALPTVILGFLAGLWLAPIIEDQLTAVMLSVFVLPIGMLVFALLWDLAPNRLTNRFDGWFAALSVPVLIVLGVTTFSMDDQLEALIFGGNAQAWFSSALGLDYDQRNAMVVGIAMGLAVIPVIFSISEDAIYGVPRDLVQGSLALGATPWQTLTRVVILTASPGIFSAVMIGLGRAVGETMIVLMATGNTPVMDINLFQGMRTFAANIAVELPEAELDSSHYRILFLTALVLFIITFAFNTIAEVVKQRLRTRYGNL